MDPELAKPCIEIEFLTGDREPFTVAEYEEKRHQARNMTNPRAISFFRVRWVADSPRVEELTTEWQKPGTERFRISDPRAYDHQMRQLLGLV